MNKKIQEILKEYEKETRKLRALYASRIKDAISEEYNNVMFVEGYQEQIEKELRSRPDSSIVGNFEL